MLVTHTQTHTVARPSVRIRSYISFNRSRRIAVKWSSNERTRAFTGELTGGICTIETTRIARNVDAGTIDRRRESGKAEMPRSFLDSRSTESNRFRSMSIIRQFLVDRGIEVFSSTVARPQILETLLSLRCIDFRFAQTWKLEFSELKI